MRIIEAAKRVIEANKSTETGTLQAAIKDLEQALLVHDDKIEANRERKLQKKQSQGE